MQSVDVINRYRPDYPLEIGLVVTTRCNFRCLHCSAVQPTIGFKDMSRKLVHTLLQEFIEENAFTINVTGGEPFLYPHIWEVLDRIEESQCELHLNSNFSTLKKTDIERLAAFYNIHHIDVTFHAGRSRFNDFTGNDLKVYDKIMENIRHANSLGLRIAITTTINNYNKKSFEEIVRDVSMLNGNAPIVATLTHPAGRGLKNWDILKIKPSERKELELFMTDTAAKYGVEVVLQTNFPAKNYSPKYMKTALRRNLTGCPCGEFSCFVWPEGSVSWCPYSVDPFFTIGNVSDRSLRSVWNNGQVNKNKVYRYSNMKEPCKWCTFLKICKGGCPVDAHNINNSVLLNDPACPFSKRVV